MIVYVSNNACSFLAMSSGGSVNIMQCVCVCVFRLTVEGVALCLRSEGTRGLAGTLVVELPDEPFLPESSTAVRLSA